MDVSLCEMNLGHMAGGLLMSTPKSHEIKTSNALVVGDGVAVPDLGKRR